MITCDQCHHSVTAYDWHTKQKLCEHLLLDALAGTKGQPHPRLLFPARIATPTAV